MYYHWPKDFLKAGKKRLAGDTAPEVTSDEVKGFRREASALKQVVADLPLKNCLLKKRPDWEHGEQRMKYPASEKIEIISLAEQSHLLVRGTLGKIGIPQATLGDM